MRYQPLLFASLGSSDYFTPVLQFHFLIDPTRQNLALLANLSLPQTISSSLLDYLSVSLTMTASRLIGSHEVTTTPLVLKKLHRYWALLTFTRACSIGRVLA